MLELTFGRAIDAAIEDAMSRDATIVLMGEDAPLLRPSLFARFGPERVLATPISESSFLGVAAGAAMAGLRPVAELYMVDFLAVALDAVLNHMAKLEAFSGGTWTCPVLIRAPCGAGYGDGSQHGQSLWGMLASIPGLTVVVPSTPNDAYGLTTTALAAEGPVVLMEPKLLSEEWLEFLGRCGRDTVTFDVPAAGARGLVDPSDDPIPFGRAVVRRAGSDVTICSIGVGAHRAIEAADTLSDVSCEVIDLRSVRPLDIETVATSVEKTGRLLVVDEDYRECGMSGELAATALEAGLKPHFGRVCLESTLPYEREREAKALPNVARIRAGIARLMQS